MAGLWRQLQIVTIILIIIIIQEINGLCKQPITMAVIYSYPSPPTGTDDEDDNDDEVCE